MRTRFTCVALLSAALAAGLMTGCAEGPATAEKAPEAREVPPAAPAPAERPSEASPAAETPAPATPAASDPSEAAPAGAAATKDPHSLAVPDVGKATVKVDGILDDAVWKKAVTSEAFGRDDGSKAGARTRLLVARGAGKVYVAVQAFDEEANLKNLVASVLEHDGDGIWEDDDVELFIGAEGNRKSYYQIIVNPKGAAWDSYMSAPRDGDSSWDPEYELSVKVGKESWNVEFVLPMKIFDRTEKLSSTWDFNVLRGRTAAAEYIYWSPVGAGSSSHQPTKFGTLSGMPTEK